MGEWYLMKQQHPNPAMGEVYAIMDDHHTMALGRLMSQEDAFKMAAADKLYEALNELMSALMGARTTYETDEDAVVLDKAKAFAFAALQKAEKGGKVDSE